MTGEARTRACAAQALRPGDTDQRERGERRSSSDPPVLKTSLGALPSQHQMLARASSFQNTNLPSAQLYSISPVPSLIHIGAKRVQYFVLLSSRLIFNFLFPAGSYLPKMSPSFHCISIYLKTIILIC